MHQWQGTIIRELTPVIAKPNKEASKYKFSKCLKKNIERRRKLKFKK